MTEKDITAVLHRQQHEAVLASFNASCLFHLLKTNEPKDRYQSIINDNDPRVATGFDKMKFPEQDSLRFKRPDCPDIELIKFPNISRETFASDETLSNLSNPDSINTFVKKVTVKLLEKWTIPNTVPIREIPFNKCKLFHFMGSVSLPLVAKDIKDILSKDFSDITFPKSKSDAKEIPIYKKLWGFDKEETNLAITDVKMLFDGCIRCIKNINSDGHIWFSSHVVFNTYMIVDGYIYKLCKPGLETIDANTPAVAISYCLSEGAVILRDTILNTIMMFLSINNLPAEILPSGDIAEILNPISERKGNYLSIQEGFCLILNKSFVDYIYPIPTVAGLDKGIADIKTSKGVQYKAIVFEKNGDANRVMINERKNVDFINTISTLTYLSFKKIIRNIHKDQDILLGNTDDPSYNTFDMDNLKPNATMSFHTLDIYRGYYPRLAKRYTPRSKSGGITPSSVILLTPVYYPLPSLSFASQRNISDISSLERYSDEGKKKYIKLLPTKDVKLSGYNIPSFNPYEIYLSDMGYGGSVLEVAPMYILAMKIILASYIPFIYRYRRPRETDMELALINKKSRLLANGGMGILGDLHGSEEARLSIAMGYKKYNNFVNNIFLNSPDGDKATTQPGKKPIDKNQLLASILNDTLSGFLKSVQEGKAGNKTTGTEKKTTTTFSLPQIVSSAKEGHGVHEDYSHSDDDTDENVVIFGISESDKDESEEGLEGHMHLDHHHHHHDENDKQVLHTHTDLWSERIRQTANSIYGEYPHEDDYDSSSSSSSSYSSSSESSYESEDEIAYYYSEEEEGIEHHEDVLNVDDHQDATEDHLSSSSSTLSSEYSDSEDEFIDGEVHTIHTTEDDLVHDSSLHSDDSDTDDSDTSESSNEESSEEEEYWDDQLGSDAPKRPRPKPLPKRPKKKKPIKKAKPKTAKPKTAKPKTAKPKTTTAAKKATKPKTKSAATKPKGTKPKDNNKPKSIATKPKTKPKAKAKSKVVPKKTPSDNKAKDKSTKTVKNGGKSKASAVTKKPQDVSVIKKKKPTNTKKVTKGGKEKPKSDNAKLVRGPKKSSKKGDDNKKVKTDTNKSKTKTKEKPSTTKTSKPDKKKDKDKKKKDPKKVSSESRSKGDPEDNSAKTKNKSRMGVFAPSLAYNKGGKTKNKTFNIAIGKGSSATSSGSSGSSLSLPRNPTSGSGGGSSFFGGMGNFAGRVAASRNTNTDTPSTLQSDASDILYKNRDNEVPKKDLDKPNVDNKTPFQQQQKELGKVREEGDEPESKAVVGERDSKEGNDIQQPESASSIQRNQNNEDKEWDDWFANVPTSKPSHNDLASKSAQNEIRFIALDMLRVHGQ